MDGDGCKGKIERREVGREGPFKELKWAFRAKGSSDYFGWSTKDHAHHPANLDH